MRFINWCKERCTAMLNASPFARKKMVKEVEILDDEIQSRYDKIHGTNGLCTALIEVFNAMAQLRMMADYGDYLAHTCLALKGDNMNDMIWKIQKLDWQAVTTQIKQEETRLAEEKARRLAPSPTPFLDDVARAANKLGYEKSMVRYQIVAYGERNNLCHTGIKAMIHHVDFQQLGERIVEDKRSLDVIFRGRPHGQIEMRRLIKVVEKEWFYRLYVDETRKERLVKFVPSEKALERMRSLAPARPPSPF